MIQPNFWNNPEMTIRNAYRSTDKFILENSMKLGPDLWVANIGDSRAVLCERGSASQLTVDHEPHSERRRIEKQGGFVTTLPGDVPRLNGQLAVARAFGDQSLKAHLSSEPDIRHVPIDSTMEFVILASDGLWKVMNNQYAVDVVKSVKDPQAAAKRLTTEALARKSKDDISSITTMVVKLVGGDYGVALPVAIDQLMVLGLPLVVEVDWTALPVAMDQLMPPGLQLLVGNILLLVMELELLTGGVDMVVLHNIEEVEEVAAPPVLVMEAASCVDNK
ncbi:hypothetical protein RJ640_025554 [Escallonia rubra]|uniref:PPM-type phosphatase domain-containing protein n=1 Tax=Escallonia rubra TaxID=112253 RepID=A0AA88U6B2_9ASTE|nr:hypothetical protein RJ640_025554 [Escallonia rubra]